MKKDLILNLISYTHNYKAKKEISDRILPNNHQNLSK